MLKYPPEVQKEIVDHYIEIRNQVAAEDEEEDVAENASFDRATYNRKMNRPEGAGASGKADEVINSYLEGTLAEVGEATCNHHDYEHHGDHDCGHGGCHH